ncbi:glycine-rich protein 5-like [Salvia splendens]|uniref:glycine-rich protein 5-like n=1 Tax=Salvia splendens TaxID=180675 RepID=UPI001C25F082|nr:glycine-rich protein 5-like [Salvia splendens]
MAKLSLIVLLALALVAAHATARNIPTDHQTENPKLNALAPSQNSAGAVADEKNFLSYGGGVGGWGGIGYVGVLPVIGGVGGVGGAGGVGGLGGLGGLGGGIGKVGGIGIGGGIGKVGGIGVGGGIVP